MGILQRRDVSKSVRISIKFQQQIHCFQSNVFISVLEFDLASTLGVTGRQQVPWSRRIFDGATFDNPNINNKRIKYSSGMVCCSLLPAVQLGAELDLLN